MKIALATPSFPKSIDDALLWVDKLAVEAAGKGAEIVCFPETYIPGYPMEEYNVQKASAEELKLALAKVQGIAAVNNITVIIPMDWYDDDKFLNVAFVISNTGEILGYQAKTQLDPSEDRTWIPGTERKIFEVNNVKFGISICHEGFRYPETVRWAARNGAQVVFHPHFAGSDATGVTPTEWGDKNSPYYEKAMMMRSIENGIYFASVNYATKYPESATTLIGPTGAYVAHQPYTQAGVLIAEIDPKLATAHLAKRFSPERYS